MMNEDDELRDAQQLERGWWRACDDLVQDWKELKTMSPEEIARYSGRRR